MREIISTLPFLIRLTFSYTNNSITTPIRTYRHNEVSRFLNAVLIRLDAYKAKYWEKQGIIKVADIIRNYDLLD